MAALKKLVRRAKPSPSKHQTRDLSSLSQDSLLNQSYGLVLGAAIGDSLGSYLEFSRGGSKSEVIDHAMSMPGGGTWGKRVTSGQVTDDTELGVWLRV